MAAVRDIISKGGGFHDQKYMEKEEKPYIVPPS